MLAGGIGDANPGPAPVLPDDPDTTAPGIDRRQWVAGAIAAGAAALGGVAWWRSGYRPTGEAAELYRKGVEARSLGLMESNGQATAYFRQAVRADLNYADAWGALARQFAGRLGESADSQLDRQADDVRSAAGRALALDPDQADAQSALAVIRPHFRNWRQYEIGVQRVLHDHPGQRQATIASGSFYSNVARWNDSIANFREVRRQLPLSPGPTGSLVMAYWSADRLEEAEAASASALERWPRFHGTWFSRMILLTYGGRPDLAVAFAENPEYYPSGEGAERTIALRLATARALVSRNAAQLAQVRNQLLANVENEILNVPQAVRFFSAVGERDVIFELLDAYFYRRGRFASADLAPIYPMTRIMTDFLFYPTSRLLWKDPRFAMITRDIGLDDYWRAVGFVPAFRQG